MQSDDGMAPMRFTCGMKLNLMYEVQKDEKDGYGMTISKRGDFETATRHCERG